MIFTWTGSFAGRLGCFELQNFMDQSHVKHAPKKRRRSHRLFPGGGGGKVCFILWNNDFTWLYNPGPGGDCKDVQLDEHG